MSLAQNEHRRSAERAGLSFTRRDGRQRQRHSAQDATLLPTKQYARLADIDAGRYTGVEIEALAMAPSHADAAGAAGAAGALKVFASADEGPIAMYSVFLRSGAGASERIGDFATCVEALDYAESIMTFQRDRGIHWTRGGKIFDLYCVSSHADELRFLARASKSGALEWTADPAEAMVFNRSAGHGQRPDAFLPESRFRKHPWLAAQAQYAQRRNLGATPTASAMAVLVKTMPTHPLGASFAELQVDEAFTLRLLRLQRLCISKRLGEVRVDAAPKRWGPGEVRAELGLSGDQLIVTQATFQFVAQAMGTCVSAETCPQNIVGFLRTVRAHPPDRGTLVMEEDDCGDLAKGTD
ncbi:hypothetical protein QFZ42_002405 [Variovorax paradoxus]|uniref:hypothetical protein n=1 Tax=Variovorax paradoxus TaxID=34073 RepID=UPI0027913F12|nr:hypothetical protein [Variovorax paradoxus]MDQ0570571.1 hypothetical protein [Variovorax paradoxus]